MSNMAARGILRLGTKLHLTRTFELNVPKIYVLTSQVGCVNCAESRQRHLHSVVQCSQHHIFNRQLPVQQYRRYKTSEYFEDRESSEQEEVNGEFDKYGISEITQNKLRSMGIKYLFPVQYHTFKPTIEGTDVIVQARTGTGKTLSFALPIVEKLQQNPGRFRQRGRKPLVVVLTPTRELANQVREEFQKLSDNVQVTCVYGGVSAVPQIQAIRNGVDVVVGTPGRMKDLMEQGVLSLSQLEHVILDEVDRMLDMGFDEQVEDIIKDCYTTGEKPQTMLYSATMPDWVKRTARNYLDNDYELISLVGAQSEQTATTIKQYAVPCRATEQPALISDFVKLFVKKDGRAIVFCQTKKEVDQLCLGVLKKEAKGFHGDIAQASRSYILKGFKDGDFKVLITTDVAARGLDIPNIDLVIQAQPPSDTSFYIHRVGRTGRAGQTGMSVLLYQSSETQMMKDCERVAKVKFERLKPPTVNQMLEICVKTAVSDILNVPEDLSQHFHMAADMMIEEKGAKPMLAAAMALVSRAGNYFNRSLITRQEGYTTLLYTGGRGMGANRFALDKIHGYLRELNVPVKNAHLLQDSNGVVFDVETDNVHTVLKGFDDIKSEDSEGIEKINNLPEIMEHRHSFKEPHRHGRHGRPFKRTSRQRFDFFDDDDDEFDSHFAQHSSKNRYQNNRYSRQDRFDSPRDRDYGYRSFKPSDRGQFNRGSSQLNRGSSQSNRRSMRDMFDEDDD
ncbi:ATP-dependent RNA helicase DDX50-like [Mercenaria mercenaria]|uniref:ATP-dependent RNA helicase DDX50-like n=1 Tax=Mercenaria mercenaria TaxID=6596 RepID=UPI00234F48C1|nr:ATP-dependent RNA helicase DDX50-like [Mercenaria mercenaria]